MKTAEDILNQKGNVIISINDEATLGDALEIMTKKRIGAIVVTRKNEVVGIWTERDLMKNCLEDQFNPKTGRIGKQMTTNLLTAKYSDNVYELLDKFLGKRIRHLLIEKDGKYIGILSSGDVIRAAMDDKEQELKRLNEIFNWEYYEDWKWKKK